MSTSAHARPGQPMSWEEYTRLGEDVPVDVSLGVATVHVDLAALLR